MARDIGKKNTMSKYHIGEWEDYIPEEPFGEIDVVDSEGQCLTFRAGPVFVDNEDKGLGIWIGYQKEYQASKPVGDVLISFSTLEKILEHININKKAWEDFKRDQS